MDNGREPMQNERKSGVLRRTRYSRLTCCSVSFVAMSGLHTVRVMGTWHFGHFSHTSIASRQLLQEQLHESRRNNERMIETRRHSECSHDVNDDKRFVSPSTRSAHLRQCQSIGIRLVARLLRRCCIPTNLGLSQRSSVAIARRQSAARPKRKCTCRNALSS